MPRTPSVSELDPFDQQKLDLLHAAATELWIGPESDDVLVQVAFHAVLAWLRGVTSTPRGVLATVSHPAGPLGAQLGFVGSLLHDPETPWPSEPPRLWWWVVKAAYYRRWHELTQRGWRPEAAGMTVRTASDQCPAPTVQVSVRFNQPREFVAELQVRGPTLEPLVRLTLLSRRGQLRDGTPLPVQELSVHASYLRRTGDVVQLVTLDHFVGDWWGIPQQDARTQERADQVLELVRAAAGAAGLEVAPGRYVVTSGR